MYTSSNEESRGTLWGGHTPVSVLRCHLTNLL
nr:MAG TPA: hypothetical protein [Caudoviricetes sp.]